MRKDNFARERSHITLITILYSIGIVVFNLVFSYNVSLSNPSLSVYSFSWTLFLIFNLGFILIKVRHFITESLLDLNKYLSVYNMLVMMVVIQTITVILSDLIIMKQLNPSVYVKFLIALLVVSTFSSVAHFFYVSFHRQRSLLSIWILAFVGTVVLAPLIVEASAFVRDQRFRVLLDFWNWIVPYQSIEHLRQFILLEGWQELEVALGSILTLAVYWFLYSSFCLYLRQLQSDWRHPAAFHQR